MLDTYIGVGVICAIVCFLVSAVTAVLCSDTYDAYKRHKKNNFYSSSEVAEDLENAQKFARISCISVALIPVALVAWPTIGLLLIYRMARFGWDK